MTGTLNDIGGALLYEPPAAAQRLIVTCCGDEITKMLDSDMIWPLTRQGCAPFALLAIDVDDWDACFTPWPSDAMPGRDFAGRADALYDQITTRYLPEARRRMPSLNEMGIAGYSLGGLFAMYAASRADSPFTMAATMSGSMWYPGFLAYAEQAPFPKLKRAYLSLGLKEAKRARGIMASNADVTRAIHEMLAARLGGDNAILEWNNGDHFYEVDKRILRGLRWLNTVGEACS